MRCGVARLAIVTASQKVDAAGVLAPDDLVQVIDPSRPAAGRITQTVHASAGAGEIAIKPVGTLALITNSTADTVSVFTMRGGQFAPIAAVALDA